MLKRWSVAFLAIACLGTSARADLIFGFSTKVGATVSPALPGSTGTVPVTIGVGTSGSLTFTPQASPSETADGGLGDDINFGQVAFTAGAASTLKTFSENFAFEVTITDNANSLSGTVYFYGNLAGSLRGGASPSISSSFKWRDSSAGSLSGLLPPTQTLTLGTHLYTIDLVGATSPSKAAPGVLQARVLAVNLVPEPSSIALSGVGIVGALAMFGRRRRDR